MTSASLNGQPTPHPPGDALSRQPTRPGQGDPSWQALRWLFLFRLLVLIGLILIFSPSALDPLIAPESAQLAWHILIVYAVLVLLSGLGIYAHWPGRQSQVHLAVYIDILAYVLLMHAAGGVGSGLGLLLVVAVAVGALMMEGRLALLFAAFGALAVLTEQTYVDLTGHATTASYTQAGLLGLILFAVALIAQVLYRRVRAAEALAARRTVDIASLTKLNAFVIDNLTTGVLVVDGERRLRLANQAALNLLGVERVAPRDRLQTLSSDLATWLAAEVSDPTTDGRIVQIGPREVRARLQLLGDYRASGALIYLRDHQELTREAQQIKLAALGTLTASIAHNIRNPLSAITHAVQLFAEEKELPEDDRHLLDIIRRNSMRIDETVRSILQLSRRNQMEPISIDLSLWLRELAEELRETHRLPVGQCRVEVDVMHAWVEVDPRHLHQIVVNLLENALLHAGTPDRPPRVTIRLNQTGGAMPRSLVEVCDDGPGIPETALKKIFDPFFTTRSSGTGLGLYIAKELAATNGIELTYERVAPRGSRFNLLFAT